MRKVYDRIIDMRGNLITVLAQKGSAWESWRSIHKAERQDDLCLRAPHRRRSSHPASHLKTRAGISTNDHVTFLGKQMQATSPTLLLGRRFNGAGDPIDGGPAIVGDTSTSTRPPSILSKDHSARARPHQHSDDRCLQLPRQIAENPHLFRCRRALQRSSDADCQPDRCRCRHHCRHGAPLRRLSGLYRQRRKSRLD